MNEWMDECFSHSFVFKSYFAEMLFYWMTLMNFKVQTVMIYDNDFSVQL